MASFIGFCDFALYIAHRNLNLSTEVNESKLIKNLSVYRSFRPQKSVPSKLFMALLAMSSLAKVTNPYDKVLPVLLFLLIFTSSI